MSSFLKKEGYQVAVAKNGVEGLQRARELRQDVITLDVAMPGMDGFELLLECLSPLLSFALLTVIPFQKQEWIS
jgi:CheY-like chemotaxis protein